MNTSPLLRPHIKIAATIAALLILLSLISPIRVHAALPKAIFINDSVRTEPIMNYFKRVEGNLYVTINCFDELEGFNYSYDQRRYQLYVRNSNDETSLTFDMNSGKAMTSDHRFFDATAAMINHILYVPAQFMAYWLNYGYYENDKYVFLFDSRITKSFSQLISEYEESLKPVPTLPPTASPDVSPEPSPEITPGPSPSVPPVIIKNAALFFRGIGESTSEILDILLSENVHAVFFLSNDDIIKYPDKVRHIYAQGHAIGISPDPGPEDAESSLIEANNTLEKLLKYRARLCLWPGPLPPGKGYIQCRNLFDLSDFPKANIKNAFAQAVRSPEASLIMLGNDSETGEKLEIIFENSENLHVSFFLFSEIDSKNSRILN